LKATILLTVWCLTAISISCRKEAGLPPASPPRNTWTYAGLTHLAAYSETDTRGGYKITFRPGGDTGLTHGLSFQFKEKPTSAGTYSIARNAYTSNQVTVILETDTISSYYSLGTDNATLRTTITSGKLDFSGENIRMVRDTIPALADSLNVSFELREF